MDGGGEAEHLRRLLGGADVLLDALTLDGLDLVLLDAGDEGQSMSLRSHRNSRALNLGNPGQAHQRTSRLTFFGGTHCRSMVELLDSEGRGVVAK